MPIDAATQRIADDLRKHGWILGDRLGGGGGGDVYRCYSAQFASAVTADMDQASPSGVGGIEERIVATTRVMGALHRVFETENDLIAAVKITKAPATEGERERVAREIEAMRRCKHPRLVPVLASDANRPPGWLVMPYYQLGDVEARLSEYRGQPLKVLTTVRPLVDALCVLHAANLTHRDIKAHNIFVARNGNWILGDLGIVFDPEAERMTTHTVFSKHWRPDWVDGVTLDQYGPDVDIFMTAKLIYFMVSGLKVPASQIDEPNCDVRRLLPGVPGIEKVHQFFLDHVVTKQSELKSKTATELGARIDALVTELTRPRVRRLVFGYTATHTAGFITDNLHPVPIELAASDVRLRCHLRLWGGDHRASPNFRFRLGFGDAASDWNFTREVLPGLPGQWAQACELELPLPVSPGTHFLSVHWSPASALLTGIQVFAE